MRVTQIALTTMIVVAAAAGCSSTSGTPVQPIFGGTPTPITLSEDPELLCSLSNDSLLGSFPSVPGVYALIEAIGNIVGTTFTPVPISTASGASPAAIWEAVSVTATASPTPSPTPVPTTGTPSPSPTPSELFDIWLGVYDVPAFAAPAPTPSSGPTATPVAVSATHGCMLFIHLVQPSSENFDGSSINAIGIGLPFDPNSNSINTNSLASGFIPTFNLTNLTSAGGSGTFVLDTGTDGTFSVGAMRQYTFGELRRLQDALHRTGGPVSAWRI